MGYYVVRAVLTVALVNVAAALFHLLFSGWTLPRVVWAFASLDGLVLQVLLLAGAFTLWLGIVPPETRENKPDSEVT